MTLRCALFRGPIAAALLLLAACGQAPVMRGRIDGLHKLATQAERNGAIRCAPRELALAKSHLEFAAVELDQGFVSRADVHLAIAEPNAHAAYDLSPPETCAERQLALPQAPDDPDTDGDGVADSRDMCVLEAEDKDGYLDDDGCPEADNDLDGVADASDKCPTEPEDPDGFDDQDGCPDLDNDKDTIADLEDQCPNEPGPAGGDRPGCPRQSLVVVTDKEIKITQQIHFEFDKDIIRRESYPILDAVAEVLQKNSSMRIEVQGHTDNKGAPAYNLKLSDRRAASVRKYLVGKGISSDRLVSRGYGLTRPLVPNDSEQNRALNRRVQFMRTEGATP
jgi:outer membrane protein OmpA-like peptidoglycan-associated protein